MHENADMTECVCLKLLQPWQRIALTRLGFECQGYLTDNTMTLMRDESLGPQEGLSWTIWLVGGEGEWQVGVGIDTEELSVARIGGLSDGGQEQIQVYLKKSFTCPVEAAKAGLTFLKTAFGNGLKEMSKVYDLVDVKPAIPKDTRKGIFQ